MTQRKKRHKSPAADSSGIVPAKKRSRHDANIAGGTASQPPRKRTPSRNDGDKVSVNMRRSSRRDKRTFEIDSIGSRRLQAAAYGEAVSSAGKNSLEPELDQSPKRTRASRRRGDTEPSPAATLAVTQPKPSVRRKVVFEMDEIEEDHVPVEAPKKHGGRRSGNSNSRGSGSPSSSRRRSSEEVVGLAALPEDSHSNSLTPSDWGNGSSQMPDDDNNNNNSGSTRRGESRRKKGKHSSRRKTVFEEDELESPSKTVKRRDDVTASSGVEPARRVAVFEEDELDSTSDEEAEVGNDVDFMIDLPDDDDDEGEEEEAANLSPLADVGSDDYKMFLRSCLGEDGSVLPHPTEDALAALLDDDQDIDFDYLREAAIVPDDPYEYRDDRAVHVSNREVVQLVQHQDTLRMRTRQRKGNRIAADSNQDTVSNPQTVTLMQPQQIAPAPVNITVPNYNYANQVPGLQVQQITAEDIALLQDQYAQHVHLLAVIHADASRLLAQGNVADGDDDAETGEHIVERTVGHAQETLDITTNIAKSLQARKETSQAFWNLVAPFRNVHEQSGRGGEQFSHPFEVRDTTPSAAPIVSLFDTPALRHMAGLLEECKTADWESFTPLELVASKLGNTVHPHVAKVAKSKPVEGMVTTRSGPRTLRFWSLQDDCLLHMTLHKHSRDFGKKYIDLLPHRTEAECKNRVKYLSSRRVCENPIKRFVMDNSVALSKQEIEILKNVFKNRHHGVNYGVDIVADNYLWKCIQRDFFPNREISMLRKLWELRETRRMYKIKYREKQRRTKEGSGDQRSNAGAVSVSAVPSTANTATVIVPNITNPGLADDGFNPQLMIPHTQQPQVRKAQSRRSTAQIAPAPVPAIAPSPLPAPRCSGNAVQIAPAPVPIRRARAVQIAPAAGLAPVPTPMPQLAPAPRPMQLAPAPALAPMSRPNIAPGRRSGATPIAPAPTAAIAILPRTPGNAVPIAPAPFMQHPRPIAPAPLSSTPVPPPPPPHRQHNGVIAIKAAGLCIPGPPPLPPPLPPRSRKRPIVTKLNLS